MLPRLVRINKETNFIGYEVKLHAEYKYKYQVVHTWYYKTTKEVIELIEKINSKEGQPYLKTFIPEDHVYNSITIIEHCENGDKFAVVYDFYGVQCDPVETGT